jgi:hypothetical protein
VSAARLGRGGGSEGEAQQQQQGLGPLAQAASDLGETGEGVSDAYSAFAQEAGRASALTEGAGRALEAVAATLGAMERGAGSSAGAGAVARLVSVLGLLRQHLAVCASLCREMGAGAEALRCVRDSVVTQQATSVRLLELAAAEDPPVAGGEECPVLLARLCALAATLEAADLDWALFDRQLSAAADIAHSLCCGLVAWAMHLVPSEGEAAPALQELPRVLEGLRKRAAAGALQGRGLRSRAAAAWDKYAAAAQHLAATAARLEGEAAAAAAGAGGSSSSSAEGEALAPTTALHLRFTAATLGSMFCFPAALAQVSRTLPRPQAFFSSANPAPQCPATLFSTLLLREGAASIGALAAFPLLPLLSPMAVSLVPVQAPLVVEPLGKEHWHRWSVPMQQVVTLSASEVQGIKLCPPAALEGMPDHLGALHARVAEGLLAVEAARYCLATVPCLQALAALAQPGMPLDACALEVPVLRVVLAALLLLVCPDGEDCRAVVATAQAAAPSHCSETALGKMALLAPRVCASRTSHPFSSALAPAEEAAAAALALREGFSPPSLPRAALEGAFLSRLVRAEATLEVPLAEALQVFATAQIVIAALDSFQQHQRTLVGNRKKLVVGQPVHAEHDAAVLAQATAYSTARHKALNSTVVCLLDVCDQHGVARLPVVERAQRLLAEVHLPSLTFLNPAVAALKAFCEALLRAELLCLELTRQCLRHTASLLHLEIDPAAPLLERTAPHLQHQPPAPAPERVSELVLAEGKALKPSEGAPVAVDGTSIFMLPVSRNTLQALARDINQRRPAHIFSASDAGRLPGV